MCRKPPSGLRLPFGWRHGPSRIPICSCLHRGSTAKRDFGFSAGPFLLVPARGASLKKSHVCPAFVSRSLLIEEWVPSGLT